MSGRNPIDLQEVAPGEWARAEVGAPPSTAQPPIPHQPFWGSGEDIFRFAAIIVCLFLLKLYF